MNKTKPAPEPRTPPNLDLDQIMQYFATDEKAREYLEAVRWLNGQRCPIAGTRTPSVSTRSRRIRPRRSDQGSGTVPSATPNLPSPWGLSSRTPRCRSASGSWHGTCSSKKGFSGLQLQRALDLGSYRTAWFMMHRIRYALRDPSFS